VSAEHPAAWTRAWKPATVGEFCEFFDGLFSESPVRIYLDGEELDVASLDTTHGDEYELILERRPDAR
jgi:hypothetical protein